MFPLSYDRKPLRRRMDAGAFDPNGSSPGLPYLYSPTLSNAIVFIMLSRAEKMAFLPAQTFAGRPAALPCRYSFGLTYRYGPPFSSAISFITLTASGGLNPYRYVRMFTSLPLFRCRIASRTRALSRNTPSVSR